MQTPFIYKNILSQPKPYRISSSHSNPQYPPHPSPFEDALSNCLTAKNMIESRLQKLQSQRTNLSSLQSNYALYKDAYPSITNLRTLANAKGHLANPSIYNSQFMDPIYYPIEMPVSAEPVTLPKVEMGMPMKATNQNGMGIEDLLALLAIMRRKRKVYIPQPQQQPIIKIEPPRFPTPKPLPVPRQKTIIPQVKRPPSNDGKIKRDWWQLCIDFIHVYTFFSTARKYAKFAKVRDNLIQQKANSIKQEMPILKEWIQKITKPLWDELKVIKDLNVSFKNIDNDLKIEKQAQIIMTLLRKGLEGIVKNGSEAKALPSRIREILYNYIKIGAYYPQNFLTTFEINRLGFDFYGGLGVYVKKTQSFEQSGMIITNLLLRQVLVRIVLLNVKENFMEFRNYPYIEITTKYIGSVLHYIMRDTFKNNPVMNRELLSLFNYYRNYHIYNSELEKQKDVYSNNLKFLDNDDFEKFLIPEKDISKMWKFEKESITNFSDYLLKWAVKIAGEIKRGHKDANKKMPYLDQKLNRPPKKTAQVIELDDDEEEQQQ